MQKLIRVSFTNHVQISLPEKLVSFVQSFDILVIYSTVEWLVDAKKTFFSLKIGCIDEDMSVEFKFIHLEQQI